MKCPHCGQEHSNQTRICPLTGSEILFYACPRCGKEVAAQAENCTYCNLPLRQQTPPPGGSTGLVKELGSRLWLNVAALVVGLALLAVGGYLIYRVLTSASEEIAGKTPIPNAARTAWITLVFDATHTPGLPTATPPRPTPTPSPTATFGPSPTPTDLVAPVHTESAGNLPFTKVPQPSLAANIFSAEQRAAAADRRPGAPSGASSPLSMWWVAVSGQVARYLLIGIGLVGLFRNRVT